MNSRDRDVTPYRHLPSLRDTNMLAVVSTCAGRVGLLEIGIVQEVSIQMCLKVVMQIQLECYVGVILILIMILDDIKLTW